MAWLKQVVLPGKDNQLLASELELLEVLKQKISESNGTVKELAKGDKRVKLLRSIPGLGWGNGGLAGAIWAPLTGLASIESFDFSALILIVCFIFVGGYTTMWGPVVFVPILYGLILNLPTAIAQWGNVIFGGLLMLILAVRPEEVIDRRVLQVLRTKGRAWLGRLTGLRKSGIEVMN